MTRQRDAVQAALTHLESFRKALGIFGSIRDDERRDVYGAFLTLLGFMTGVPFTKSTILKSLQSDPALLYQKLKESLLRFFYVNLKEGPRALILDDVHKIPKSSRARRLFSDVVGELKNAPLFVICGGAETSELMRKESVIALELAPLSDKVMRNLFASMMPKLENPPADLVIKTLRQAAGNPGALYDLCSLLKESGVINTEDDE